jgi:hypothetical protein
MGSTKESRRGSQLEALVDAGRSIPETAEREQFARTVRCSDGHVFLRVSDDEVVVVNRVVPGCSILAPYHKHRTQAIMGLLT